MYYLAQGGDVTGPFGEGRILEMGDAGELVNDAQVALHGSEDWFPADDLLTTLWAERKEQRAGERRNASKIETARLRKKRPLLGVSILLSLLGVGLMIFIQPFWVGLIVLIGGACLDRVRWICGKCGNRVEKSSKLCAACQCSLTRK